MTEPTQTDDPRTCEVCGTTLAQVQVDFAEADFSDGKTGTPIARDFCPNPDCPRHQAEVAGSDRPVAPENLPGSLGGDHGGG